jgi:hypothetical protein
MNLHKISCSDETKLTFSSASEQESPSEQTAIVYVSN